MLENICKWDLRFLNVCKHIASWSKDPSTKCGAVIVAPDKIVVSMGYNGFPRHIEDNEHRLENRGIKYELTVHAEMNAIINVPCSVYGYSLYCYPFCPCANCTKHIIQVGIARVVTVEPSKDIITRWESDIILSRGLFGEASVAYQEYKLGDLQDG